MCGIAGAWHPTERVDALIVTGLLEHLGHRGPDGAGLRATEACTLGQHRLAIHDLTAAGQQPFTSADGLAMVVVNGTIHNAPELRAALESDGEVFASRSDSAVILPLYRRHGAAFVEHLVGPFAIALWDGARRRLLLARDRLGQKPLFLHEHGAGLRFASEAAALLRVAPDLSWDRGAAAAFLRAGYVPGGATAVRELRSLAPATVLLAGEDGLSERRYWSPPVDPDARMTRRDARERLETALHRAVSRRTRTERSLGVLLSGGLDSAAVLSFATQIVKRPLPSFTLGFDDRAFDERDAARATANALGSRHHDAVFDRDPGAMVEHLVETTGELLADASLLPTSRVCELASAKATVLLVGDGGDELLLGYRRHGMAQWIPRFGPRALRRAAAAGHGLIPERRLRKALSVVGGDDAEILADLVGLLPGPLWQSLVHEEHRTGPDPLTASLRSVAVPAHSGAAAGRRDLLTYLPGDLLPKIDRAAMIHGIEVWSPFLDHELVECALGIPGHLRRGLFRGKQPLRDLLRDRLPPEIRRRPKRGFGVPLARWLTAGPYATFARELLRECRAPFEGVLATGEAGSLLERHREGAPGLAPLIHACVVLAVFHRTFIGKSAAPLA